MSAEESERTIELKAVRALRKDLAEKVDKGVKQVRVTTVVARLDEIIASVRTLTRPTLASVTPLTPSRRRKNGRVTVAPADLMGAVEVARFLNVDRTRPSKWRGKKTTFGPDKQPFPEPFRELESGPVWLRSQIEPLVPFVEERRRK